MRVDPVSHNNCVVCENEAMAALLFMDTQTLLHSDSAIQRSAMRWAIRTLGKTHLFPEEADTDTGASAGEILHSKHVVLRARALLGLSMSTTCFVEQPKVQARIVHAMYRFSMDISHMRRGMIWALLGDAHEDPVLQLMQCMVRPQITNLWVAIAPHLPLLPLYPVKMKPKSFFDLPRLGIDIAWADVDINTLHVLRQQAAKISQRQLKRAAIILHNKRLAQRFQAEKNRRKHEHTREQEREKRRAHFQTCTGGPAGYRMDDKGRVHLPSLWDGGSASCPPQLAR